MFNGSGVLVCIFGWCLVLLRIFLFCFFIAEIPPLWPPPRPTFCCLFPFPIAYSCSTSIDCSVLFICLVFIGGRWRVMNMAGKSGVKKEFFVY